MPNEPKTQAPPRHVAKLPVSHNSADDLTAAKAPPAAPQLAPTPRKKIPYPLDRFIGQRAVVTTLHGTVIEGDLVDMVDGMAVFENCTVAGSSRKVAVDQLVLVMRQNVSHINSMPKAEP